jgi:hypothetical protein
MQSHFLMASRFQGLERRFIPLPFACYDIAMNKEAAFHKCGSCKKAWETWQKFIFDPEVRLLGFQGSDRYPDTNLLVFEHRCGTSISVLAKRLRHILPQDKQKLELPILYASESCNQYCNKLENLKVCDKACINARDRQLIMMILEMRKAVVSG